MLTIQRKKRVVFTLGVLAEDLFKAPEESWQ